MKKNKIMQVSIILLFLAMLVPLVVLSKYFGVFGAQKIVLFEIIVEALLPIYLFFIIKNKDFRPDIKKTGLIIATLFFGWITLSSLFGVDLINSFFGNRIRYGGLLFQVHLLAFIFYLLATFKYRPIIFKKIAIVSVVVACLASVYGLLESLGIITVYNSTFLPRAISTIGNPIFFASYLFIPLTFSLFFLVKEKKKWPYILSSVLILIGMYSSGTRGAIIGLVFGLLSATLVLFVTRNNKISKRVVIGLSASVILIVALVSFLKMSGNYELINKFTNFSDQNIFDRLRYWGIATKVINENPVFGMGYENYYSLAEKYYKTDFYEGEGVFVDKPHNQFLETLSTSGIPGAVLYLLFIAVLAKIIFYKNRSKQLTNKETAILIGGLVGYHVQNSFAFDTASASIMYAFFVGFILSLEQDNTEKEIKISKYPDWKISILAVLLPALVFYFLHLSSLKLLYSLEKSNKSKSPRESFQIMETNDSSLFIFDEAARAMEYSNIINRSLGVRIDDKDMYNKVFQKAENTYTLALEQHPRRGQYWYYFGKLYLMSAMTTGNKITFAQEQTIVRANKLMPERIETKLLEANMIELNGDIEKAIVKAKEIYDSAPLSRTVPWTLAILYLKNHSEEEAADFAIKAVDKGIRPSSTIELLHFFNYYVKKNDFDKAERFIKRAIEIAPNNTSLLPQLAATYATNGDIKKAIETAQEFIKKNPSEKEGGEVFIKQLLNQ